jgi:hypothetical protein
MVVPPLVALMLSERRTLLRKAQAAGLASGLVAAVLWWASSRVGVWWRSRTASAPAFHLVEPFDSLLLGLAVGLAVLVSFRERLRLPEDSPAEPCHSSCLRAKPALDFSTTSCCLRPFRPPSRWLVSAPGSASGCWGRCSTWRRSPASTQQWSAAWWVHLAIGLAVGCVLLPSCSTPCGRADRQAPPPASARCGLAGAFVPVALLTAFALQGLDLAGRNGRLVTALLGLSPTDRATGAPVDLASYPLVERWRETSTGIGREFMPPLDEGDFLYMPSLLPAASLSSAMEVMQRQDAVRAHPRVELVVGSSVASSRRSTRRRLACWKR